MKSTPDATTPPADAAAGPSAWKIVRDPDERIFSGVTAGLANRIGVDPLAVRIALVILTLAGGAGLLLYLLARWLSRPPLPGEQVPVHDVDKRQILAVAMITLGLTLLLRSLGIWLSDALVWPAMVAGTVSSLVWVQAGPRDASGRSKLLGLSPARIIVGSIILFAGVVTFWVLVPSPDQVIVPLAGIMIGGVLLASPLLSSVWQRMESERSELARQQARDEVAAHLHDSVLQTLTLIQRTDDPRRATTLARTQERELRAWLYGDRDLGSSDRDLEQALDDLASDIEAHHELDVETVVVGSVTRVDEHPHVPSLLRAVREALVNVARHAGVQTASVYLEVSETRITAFVRDRGTGFDPDEVPDDRHGLRHSIRERIRRHHGDVDVDTAPGEGTEIEAWVPHDPDWVHSLPVRTPAPLPANLATPPLPPPPLEHQ